jgi:hypothetical protein
MTWERTSSDLPDKTQITKENDLSIICLVVMWGCSHPLTPSSQLGYLGLGLKIAHPNRAQVCDDTKQERGRWKLLRSPWKQKNHFAKSFLKYYHYNNLFILWRNNFITYHWKFIIKICPWRFYSPSSIERHKLNLPTFSSKSSRMSTIYDVF